MVLRVEAGDGKFELAVATWCGDKFGRSDRMGCPACPYRPRFAAAAVCETLSIDSESAEYNEAAVINVE